ncbi:MAG: outer membrane protein assembly factor BamD [Acidobacteria bacterium]|nr:outer membrane protein assembly factor BamD [Acidobacteriota bacterium]
MKSAWLLLAIASIVLASGCGRRPYETPIVTNSQQPDKELFDRAIRDLESSRFNVARFTLQTLINTYPDSEYLAKAKLAIADSYYREGGSSNLLQAEAEYRDFITFFPTLPESGEAQMRVAMIHYHEMEKPDRDPTHARRAEQEFQKVLLNYPEGPFTPLAEQRLREVQEVLAQGTFDVGRFYFILGNDTAAQVRLKEVVERYPNFSQADGALYLLGRSLERSGEKTVAEAIPHYSRIIQSYPLSGRVKEAKERLTALGAPIPEPDPGAVARMTYENTLAQAPGMFDRVFGGFGRRPNVSAAQGKLGPPTLTAQGPAQAGALPSVVLQPQGSAPGSSPSQAIFLEPVPQSGTTSTPPGPRPSP